MFPVTRFQNLPRFAAACGSDSEVQDASVKRQEQLQMMSAAPPSMRPGQTFSGDRGDFGNGLTLDFAPKGTVKPLGISRNERSDERMRIYSPGSEN